MLTTHLHLKLPLPATPQPIYSLSSWNEERAGVRRRFFLSFSIPLSSFRQMIAATERHLSVSGLARTRTRAYRSRPLHVHVLQVHRIKTTRVLQEVFGRDEPGGNGRHLELKFDQHRIEQLEQQVVRPFAFDHRD